MTKRTKGVETKIQPSTGQVPSADLPEQGARPATHPISTLDAFKQHPQPTLKPTQMVNEVDIAPLNCIEHGQSSLLEKAEYKAKPAVAAWLEELDPTNPALTMEPNPPIDDCYPPSESHNLSAVWPYSANSSVEEGQHTDLLGLCLRLYCTSGIPAG